MKKLLKGTSIFICLILLLSMTSFTVLAAETPNEAEKQVISKKTFSTEMDRKYSDSLKTGKIRNFDEAEIKQLQECYFFSNSFQEKKFYKEKLEEYGIYIFDEISEPTISPNSLIGFYPTSGSNDVTLIPPSLSYNSSNKTWTLSCGGNWKNNNCYPTFGLGNEVGDPDAFGVGFTSISSSYKSSVVSAYAYIEDEMKVTRVTTTNRSDGDGSKGFGFRLQDKLSSNSLVNSGYIGYRWYGSCTYDSNFSSFACIATGYYIHTYGSAEIKDIQFGVEGKTAGLSVNIEKVTKSFTAFSSDKRLGS